MSNTPRIVSTDDASLRLVFTWKGPPDTPLPEARYQAWIIGLLAAPVVCVVIWLALTPVDLLNATTLGRLSFAAALAGFTGWRATRKVDRKRELLTTDSEGRDTPVRLWRRVAFWVPALVTWPVYLGLVHVVSSGVLRGLIATALGVLTTVLVIRRVGRKVSPVTPLSHHLAVLVAEVRSPRPAGHGTVTVTTPELWEPETTREVTVPPLLSAPGTPTITAR